MFSYLDQDRVLKKYCSNFQRLQDYFFVIIKALSSERDNSNVQIKTFPKRFWSQNSYSIRLGEHKSGSQWNRNRSSSTFYKETNLTFPLSWVRSSLLPKQHLVITELNAELFMYSIYWKFDSSHEVFGV